MPPVPEDEDAADARRVLAGDVAAFGGIVRRWQGRLINLAWRFSRDRASAEDMAQDAFVKAFRALHTFRGESAFSTWLTAIAINVYRSWLRDREPLPLTGDVNDLILMRARSAAPDALAGLERWRARHPEAASYLEPADVLVDAMRGRFHTWTRIRVNLQNVPVDKRPVQEALDPDSAKSGWEGVKWDGPRRRPSRARKES